MKRLLITTSLVGILVVSCSGTSPPAEPSESAAIAPVVQPGEPSPEFTLPQAAGKPVALSDFLGKPVLLYFSMGPG